MERLKQLKDRISAYWSPSYWNPKPLTEDTQKETIEEKVQKEDSLILSHYAGLQFSSTKPCNIPSHVILKLGFCCENNNGKVVATNHVAQLYSCHKDRFKISSKYLVKLPIEVN